DLVAGPQVDWNRADLHGDVIQVRPLDVRFAHNEGLSVLEEVLLLWLVVHDDHGGKVLDGDARILNEVSVGPFCFLRAGRTDRARILKITPEAIPGIDHA